jgi:hypothetical protein
MALKPRLESALLPAADQLICFRVAYRFYLRNRSRFRFARTLYQNGLELDRRDADLMLGLTDMRLDGAHWNVRHCQVWWGQDGFAMGTSYSTWVSDRWSDGRKIEGGKL